MGRRTKSTRGVAALVGRAAAFCAALSIGIGATAPAARAQQPCVRSADEAFYACRIAATADLWLKRAKCTNLPTSQQRFACVYEAYQELFEELDLGRVVRNARIGLCNAIGPGGYAIEVDPSDFVRTIDNPWLPLVPGTTRVYLKEGEDETERIEVTVSDETKEILGVTCTVVRDTVTVDDELVENTFDWYAQDVQGNVWYFGELAMNYEDGELVDLGGSWIAGANGAEPGIVMLAAPTVGAVYRQEFLLGEAEDVAAVLDVAAPVQVPFGRFPDCVQTADTTPLQPGVLEHKFYAPGVGLVLELDPATGERTELVDVFRR